MNAPDVDTTKALVEQFITGRVTAEAVAMTWMQVGKVIETRFEADYQVNEIAMDHANAITRKVQHQANQASLQAAREVRGIAAALGARPEHLAAIDRLIAEFKKEQQK